MFGTVLVAFIAATVFFVSPVCMSTPIVDIKPTFELRVVNGIQIPFQNGVIYPSFEHQPGISEGGARTSINLTGTWRFYSWMIVLTAIALVGLHAWGTQLKHGMQVTDLSDHVSWGLYIGNFTFGVGLAAGAVLMVIPAYLYDDHDMHDVVIVGA